MSSGTVSFFIQCSLGSNSAEDVNVCGIEIKLNWRLTKWSFKYTQGFNLPSPSAPSLRCSLLPSLSLPQEGWLIIQQTIVYSDGSEYNNLIDICFCSSALSHFPRRAVFHFCSRFLPTKQINPGNTWRPFVMKERMWVVGLKKTQFCSNRVFKHWHLFRGLSTHTLLG